MTENKDTNYSPETPTVKLVGLTAWVIKNKLAKNKKDANLKMLAVSIVFFSISIYFFVLAFSSGLLN
jgi:hypothetical protein